MCLCIHHALFDTYLHIPNLYPQMCVMSSNRKNLRSGVSQAPSSEADCAKHGVGYPHPYTKKKLLEELVVEKEHKKLG